jgi:hypothetical protein
MPKIKYRPSSMKSTKKESDERRKNNLDQLKAKGLDEDTARTVQMISRADRLDYQVHTTFTYSYALVLYCISLLQQW